MISIDEYTELIKTKRTESFPSPYELVYAACHDLNLQSKDETYFKSHASKIMNSLRKTCWNIFTDMERLFTSDMLNILARYDSQINTLHGLSAVEHFVEMYPEHIYKLALSNTQSRRSRAGKEFEAIIEIILRNSGIMLDSQGNIGKSVFIDKNLGKLVDIVIPSVIHYKYNKTNTILISAKTTLRERWQEVPEEMNRTATSKMYLTTLDKYISDNVLDMLYESNIILVTTSDIKEDFYNNKVNVITIEKLIQEADHITREWDNFEFSSDDKKTIERNKKLQMINHRTRSDLIN